MYLVQFHSGAEVGSGISLKYWTTIEEANGISTIDEYMDNMALMSDWGVRDNVSIARIPAETKIKYAVGRQEDKRVHLKLDQVEVCRYCSNNLMIVGLLTQEKCHRNDIMNKYKELENKLKKISSHIDEMNIKDEVTKNI